MPVKVRITTRPVRMNGALSTGPTVVIPAAFLLWDGVAVMDPEPGLASPVLVPSAEFWDPTPFSPGPVPAPAFMN